MTDFQSRLDALAQKKAAADAEKRRVEDEARARHRKYIEDMQALIEGAFDRPVRELMEKAPALGLVITTDVTGNYPGLNLRAERVSGPKNAQSLTVLPREERTGVEVVFMSYAKSNKNAMVQPHQITEEWAEKVLLSFIESMLDL